MLLWTEDYFPLFLLTDLESLKLENERLDCKLKELEAEPVS